MKRKTTVYLKAAKLIEEGYQPLALSDRPAFGCEAIAKALGHEHSFFKIRTNLDSEFESIFSDENDARQLGDGIFGSPRNPRHQDERVVALCFAAAMVEAGDL